MPMSPNVRWPCHLELLIHWWWHGLFDVVSKSLDIVGEMVLKVAMVFQGHQWMVFEILWMLIHWLRFSSLFLIFHFFCFISYFFSCWNSLSRRLLGFHCLWIMSFVTTFTWLMDNINCWKSIVVIFFIFLI